MPKTSNLTKFDLAEIVDFFYFLDDLRESGETNMWGAGAYVEAEYGLERPDARDITLAWMHTFSHDSTPEDRAAEALKQAAA